MSTSMSQSKQNTPDNRVKIQMDNVIKGIGGLNQTRNPDSLFGLQNQGSKQVLDNQTEFINKDIISQNKSNNNQNIMLKHTSNEHHTPQIPDTKNIEKMNFNKSESLDTGSKISNFTNKSAKPFGYEKIENSQPIFKPAAAKVYTRNSTGTTSLAHGEQQQQQSQKSETSLISNRAISPIHNFDPVNQYPVSNSNARTFSQNSSSIQESSDLNNNNFKKNNRFIKDHHFQKDNFQKNNSKKEEDKFLDFPPPPPELSYTETSPEKQSPIKNLEKNLETMSNSSYKRVNLSKVDITKVQSYGPGLSVVTTFQQTEFFVDLNESGPGSLQLSMMGPSDAGIRMNQDIGNKYRVSYFPKEPGNYEINVKFTDKHIPGSPFKIKCVGSGIKDLNRQKMRNSGEKAVKNGQNAQNGQNGLNTQIKTSTATVGTPVNLKLNLGYDERERHNLSSQLVNPRGQSAHLDLKFLQNDLYLVQFNPSEIGEYQVVIKNNGTAITGSPFLLRAEAPDPELAKKLSAKGAGLVSGLVDFENRFTIDTSRVPAGGGNVAVDVRGPSKASISFTANDECVYQVSKDGKYYVTIKYNGEHIPFSPFTVYVKK